MAEDILTEAEVILRQAQITEVDKKLTLRWRNMEPRFWVYVITPRYPHRGWVYKDVHIKLSHYGEASEKDAGNLLFGITDDPYVLSQVEETFTKGEVKQIHDFFSTYWRLPLKIRAERAPAPRYSYIGVGARAVGGLEDFYMFSEEPDYPLPFAMWGYVDLRHYALAKAIGIERLAGRGSVSQFARGVAKRKEAKDGQRLY